MKKFTPMKLSVDKRGYMLRQKQANRKLEILNDSLDWCKKHINADKLDRHKFIENMLSEFSVQFKKQKGNIVKADISVEKLAFLLDINTAELVDLQNQFNSINIDVQVEKEDYKVIVTEDEFTTYTKNEKENLKLMRGNNLINALELVGQYTKVYPMNIQQGTSGFLEFDMITNKYLVRVS